MKPTIILSFLILSVFVSCAQNKEAFDIVSYTIPKGWSKTQKPGTITFSKENGNDFCMITIYKSIDASDNAQTNFDMAWQSLVEENMGITSTATMQSGSTDNSWETKIGSAPFEKDGIKGAIILISSSQNNKLVNILSLTNSNAFQKEMELFLESIDLKTAMVAKPKQTAPISNVSTPKHEVWMAYKYNMTKKAYSASYFIKYTNGDCLNYLPEEGMMGFSKATAGSGLIWGNVVDKGNQQHLEFSDGTVLRLGKTAADKMAYPPESNTTFYFKCKPVDNLTLDGEWSAGGLSGPKWYQDPNYKDGSIRFYKDGRFENNNGLYISQETASGRIYKDAGKGTYAIKDFTLVLTYDDGTVLRNSFTGLKNVNPFVSNEIVYMGYTPFYKRLTK